MKSACSTRRQVAQSLGRTTDTLDHWMRQGIFPAPLQAAPGTKKQWLLVGGAGLDRRSVGAVATRHAKPRGQLRQYRKEDVS